MSTNSSFPILVTNNSENWFKNLSDDDVAVLIGMEPLESVADSTSIINSFIDRYEKKNGMAWAIILKEDESFIGTCSYEKIDSHNLSGEIGYDLLKKYWGHGFMAEALSAIIDYGFESLGLNRIEAHTAAINLASRNLLRRLGFFEEGIFRESSFFRGEFRDDCQYSLLRMEWNKLQKNAED